MLKQTLCDKSGRSYPFYSVGPCLTTLQDDLYFVCIFQINMAHCQYTKRLEPIGYDRNHARYWVFNGIAVGVYVEQGWRNLEDLSQTFDESSKEVSMETDGSKQAPFDGDVEIVGETKEERKMDAYNKDDLELIVCETKDERKMDAYKKDDVQELR